MPHAVSPRESFHPLEIFPVFRRWPRSTLRDFIYTAVWSSIFGAGFFIVSAVSAGSLPSLHAAGLMLLISNVIGYMIHGLYGLGSRMKLDCAAREAGFAAKIAYYALIPMVGVFAGIELVSFGLDRRFIDWLAQPEALVSMLLTSLVISFVISVMFYWREQGAKAAAAAAEERARTEHAEREAALANLRALQAQIEPHFLFNTLANVSSLVDPDPAKARHMLESFIRFLRASLAATRADTTTLGEEARLIASYLEVLQVRMGPRLRWRIDVAPGIESVALAPMLVQPIVENAIRHGLEPKVEGGEIALTMRREGDRVTIEVTDTGVGFAAVTRGGVGLGNIRRRLALLHGDAARLDIADHAGGGARVTMTVPA